MLSLLLSAVGPPRLSNISEADIKEKVYEKREKAWPFRDPRVRDEQG